MYPVGAGTIQIAMSTDFGTTWSDWVTLAMVGTDDYVESVANFMRTGKQVRYKFRNVSGCYHELESLAAGWIEYGVPLGR